MYMPRGLQDRRLRDPLNFSREEWQQAKRVGLDPREIKSVFRQSWEASDNRASFEQALKERGFWLARGDRRGFVAVDYLGEVYSLSRYTGVKAKELEARLGDRDQLTSVDIVKSEIAKGMSRKLEAFIVETRRDAKQRFGVTFANSLNRSRLACLPGAPTSATNRTWKRTLWRTYFC